ncbi:beta-L-arabinofuranosidase domain-containing protein [Streptomyces caniscabiei]|uniref:Glycoside hydrolase family 127 protein n=1 Tax=Streptomyces caniscabiei TaxID=2746961 RepID=A0ABU4MIH9_9ACTN|nr:beta-L-arabinofuranosidase domain-containing protein [Streptomyces caniscabiei]MBE4734804.1 glycoside hydrolase family 127 protein [Streptomyces caniscabiei]MBE4753938.1 glycoside hydrolase family 127 protein [Streptomyces caniscabiei]MBE4767531.1 glycoside hydrolase family 127 protein [Streptomyces caniscabiei]MBE4783989.1 glycoside hydrolase family 127 protein [Streptomyces caniscabiei]MBE4791512.1 glycoside hydrolase family 127 protein [Streptomyces caniscabiei]
MAPPLSRRFLLQSAMLAAAVPGVSLGTGGGRAVAAAVPTPSTWSVRPFELKDVTLGQGLFADKRRLMLDHGRGYDVDRLLQVFRANAGLSTKGAVAPGGWEGLDGEANGNLRGHYTGHFLTMLAQAYASTGEQVYADKIRTMVDALTEVREALRKDPRMLAVTGKWGGAHENVRGSYQYVDLPAAVLGGASAITLSVWVKPTHNANWQRIFDFGNNTTRYMYLASRNGSGVPRFAITNSGAGGEQALNGTAALPLNQWSHLAVTISGTTGTLYVNGTAVAQNTSMTLNPSVLGTLTNNWLGRSNYADDPVFAGAFDEFNVWSRALTTAEITSLQTNEAKRSSAGLGNLASYYFFATSGGTFDDASGRGLTATLRRTWGGPSHPGFLAAYPETQFIDLETRTTADYTKVWAPYYTAHKILKGLLDAYLATDDARALDLASGMCDWMYSRLSKLPDATLQRMWGIFSSGEFGGIVEAIVDLHTITGKAEHLALAKLFDLDRLIDACAADTDILDGLHANQHIPIMTGYVRLYDATGETRYLTAAKNFWGMVIPQRMYGIGGTSTAEFWKARGVISGTISDTNAETCCAYNLLKLSRTLFFHEQDPKYMDYYERALFNQVLGSKQDKADAEKPLVTYFIGLKPGHVRDYTPKQGTTCCEGTGMESATKYQDSVYFTKADGSALYVNLYSAATLNWSAKGVTIAQSTDYPREQGTTITVGGGSAAFELRLRVPSWATTGFRVTVNGSAVSGTPAAGSYFTIPSRTWRAGDVVRVTIPFRLRVEKALDDPSLQTLFYGPVNLVGRNSSTSYLSVGLYRNAGLSGDLLPSLAPVSGKPLHYTLDGTEFAPFHEGSEDPTHAYVRRSEPKVVLGGTDSGVANPAKSDGTTLLDEIWAGAPFADKGALVARVQSAVGSWVSAGLLSQADSQKVVTTAQNASYAA